MPKKSDAKTPTVSLTLVAVHCDVEIQLEEWTCDKTYQAFASKFLAMLEALRIGHPTAEIQHKGVFRTRLKRNKPPKVDEYGNVQKGGAPRVFGLRWQGSYIFVATGVEKNQDGCHGAINLATRRVDDLDLKLKNVTTIPEFRKALGSSYTIDVILAHPK